MPVERSADHPAHELGGNSIISLAAPSRGAVEAALYRVELPPAGGLPPHHHDHLDVFTVLRGGGTFFLGDETLELVAGDSAVVPVGLRHYLTAGPDGASLVVTMLAGTKMIRDDGSELVPPWVS
jgi:quercetin dioxygenase-like cupin family protein